MRFVNFSFLVFFLLYTSIACSQTSAEIKQALASKVETKLRLKAKEARKFCMEKNYTREYCILVDLSAHSGINRFFLYDLNLDSIRLAAPVSHGCGNMPWSYTLTKEKAKFSNKDGSHLSSVGKYRVGKRGYSNWGINVNYKMHGLEASNSNAHARQIVLHSWEEVPEKEVYPGGTQEGWGCPAVSNKTMRVLDRLLKQSKKPVLLWIYN
jgi:hypothetical protein